MTGKHFKHLIGTEEGDAFADFVLRIEEKTGKCLKAVYARNAVRETIGDPPEAWETHLNFTVEFYPTPASPPTDRQH
jgi:hypothetical protein